MYYKNGNIGVKKMSNSILKEEYLKAEIEVITFGSEDVIVTSTREYIGPYIPIGDVEDEE